MRVSPRRRLSRALAGATLTTFAALGSHVLAGAHTPTVVGVAVPWALAFVICFHLAGRSLTLARLTTAVVLSQGAFHVLFSWGTAKATLAGDLTAHHVEPGSLAVTATHTSHSGLGMTAAHIVAAAATIVAIRRADTAWRSLKDAAAQTGRRLRTLLASVPTLPAPATATAARTWAPALATSDPTATPALRRGPPVFSLTSPRTA